MEDKTWKIIAVSPTPAKPYTNNFGTTYYRDVRLADEQGNEHAKPVSLGKKSEDAFVVGAELFGHIFVEQGRPTDKFKAASKQQGSFGNPTTYSNSGSFNPPATQGSTYQKPAYQPRDDDAIRAQWAIGQALQYMKPATGDYEFTGKTEEVVRVVATKLYSMVDHVKGSNGGETPNPKAVTAPTSKPWQINGRDSSAKVWPSEHQVDPDAEAASLYATIASAEEFPEADLPPGVF